MTITTSPQALTIELHGREQFWALRAKVLVDHSSITNMRFEPMFQDWRKWQVRMPGTHAPKLLLAGSYWTEEGWDFLYIKRPIGFLKPKVENVLVIETSQDKYRRLIISVDKKLATGIVKWWKTKN
jgi:hypothetical protein